MVKAKVKARECVIGLSSAPRSSSAIFWTPELNRCNRISASSESECKALRRSTLKFGLCKAHAKKSVSESYSPTKPAPLRCRGFAAPGPHRATACACCRPVSWGCNRGRARGPRTRGWASAGTAASRHQNRPGTAWGCRSWDSGWSGIRPRFLQTGRESNHLGGCIL